MVLHVFTSLLGGAPLCIPQRLYNGNSTKRDHPGNPGGVSGSGPVKEGGRTGRKKTT